MGVRTPTAVGTERKGSATNRFCGRQLALPGNLSGVLFERATASCSGARILPNGLQRSSEVRSAGLWLSPWTMGHQRISRIGFALRWTLNSCLFPVLMASRLVTLRLL